MVFPAKTSSDYALQGQKAAAVIRKEKKEIALTDKQRALVEAMVFEGNSRKDAAEAAGMTDKGAREALMKPYVLAYLNECMEVLRTSVRPRALRKMEDLLDAKNESTQFKAAEYLDGMNRGSHTVGAAQVNVQINNNVQLDTPGYVIKLARTGGNEQEQIEHLGQGEANRLGSLKNVPADD